MFPVVAVQLKIVATARLYAGADHVKLSGIGHVAQRLHLIGELIARVLHGSWRDRDAIGATVHRHLDHPAQRRAHPLFGVVDQWMTAALLLHGAQLSADAIGVGCRIFIGQHALLSLLANLLLIGPRYRDDVELALAMVMLILIGIPEQAAQPSFVAVACLAPPLLRPAERRLRLLDALFIARTVAIADFLAPV